MSCIHLPALINDTLLYRICFSKSTGGILHFCTKSPLFVPKTSERILITNKQIVHFLAANEKNPAFLKNGNKKKAFNKKSHIGTKLAVVKSMKKIISSANQNLQKRPFPFIVSALIILSLLFLGVYSHPEYRQMLNRTTISQAAALLKDKQHPAWQKTFKDMNLTFPPKKLVFVAYKKERRFEIWAQKKRWHRVKTYTILGASGRPGPKLTEGDKQVPEGVYQLAGLNPNSRFHLSIKINYPNAFDQTQARREARGCPGSDIFIHGDDHSIGCLAMGDTAIEELFYLTHLTGLSNIKMIIAPTDRRHWAKTPAALNGRPNWVGQLYAHIYKELDELSI